MIDIIGSLIFAVFVCVAILIIAAVAYFALPILAGIVVLFGAALIVTVIWIIRTPKRAYDHYAKAFGDVPRLPHGP